MGDKYDGQKASGGLSKGVFYVPYPRSRFFRVHFFFHWETWLQHHEQTWLQDAIFDLGGKPVSSRTCWDTPSNNIECGHDSRSSRITEGDVYEGFYRASLGKKNGWFENMVMTFGNTNIFGEWF